MVVLPAHGSFSSLVLLRDLSAQDAQAVALRVSFSILVVLGVAVLNVREEYNLLYSVLNGTFGAVGFLLAIVLMAGVRERLETSNIPAPFRGFPIGIIIAGLMSMAFMGFSGFGG
ncbi:MAG: hypothetical protein EOM52_11040 [Clostridia bacterium]|nr:hypothetical protein [Clostridia bacterium]